MQKYQLLHWALILFSMYKETTKGMYVACTTETCSRILKDELMATARRSRHRHETGGHLHARQHIMSANNTFYC
jgi:hypothetical protein